MHGSTKCICSTMRARAPAGSKDTFSVAFPERRFPPLPALPLPAGPPSHNKQNTHKLNSLAKISSLTCSSQSSIVTFILRQHPSSIKCFAPLIQAPSFIKVRIYLARRIQSNLGPSVHEAGYNPSRPPLLPAMAPRLRTSTVCDFDLGTRQLGCSSLHSNVKGCRAQQWVRQLWPGRG
jgi:hypothetical protein